MSGRGTTDRPAGKPRFAEVSKNEFRSADGKTQVHLRLPETAIYETAEFRTVLGAGILDVSGKPGVAISLYRRDFKGNPDFEKIRQRIDADMREIIENDGFIYEFWVV